MNKKPIIALQIEKNRVHGRTAAALLENAMKAPQGDRPLSGAPCRRSKAFYGRGKGCKV